MAKMFYSLEEAAAKLKVSTEEVKAMADRRQLEAFRDRDRLMFKVEQVDLLSGGKGDDEIPLAESGELEPIGLASSGSGASMGSGIGLGGSGVAESPKEQTGISIFDADATDDSDPSAVTRMTSAPLAGLGATAAGDSSAGSGIMDLTRDGTGLGAGLMEDAYGATANAGSGSVDLGGSKAGIEGGGLFEGGGGEIAAPGAGMSMAAMVAAEPYDGPGSGLVGGLAFGAIVTLLLSVFTVILVLSGSGAELLEALGSNLLIVVGVLGIFTAVAAVIGWVIGKRS
ncbi:MAG TPA: helix-turn-helix domain-containing protein [Phycisphaerales bacterium]